MKKYKLVVDGYVEATGTYESLTFLLALFMDADSVELIEILEGEKR